MGPNSIQSLAAKIRGASTIILTTHKQCDGDGLGAEVALFYGLKKTGKDVRILNVDQTPKKYGFLWVDEIVECFDAAHHPIGATDLALVFDTNDHRLVEPLFSALEAKCREIAFVDHHPMLESGPLPTAGSFIDVGAASVGEIVYDLLKELGVGLDERIARGLYTSLAFDTHLFRFVRRSPKSHLIAADLLHYEKNPEEVHRRLFADYTAPRMAFLARALGQIEYAKDGRFALVKLREQDMADFGLDPDASRDVIDLVMSVETLEAAALIREEAPSRYKLSLRSKGRWDLLAAAERLGGGGHRFAAGAYLQGDYETLKANVLRELEGLASADPARSAR